jgi:hypothetical protein
VTIRTRSKASAEAACAAFSPLLAATLLCGAGRAAAQEAAAPAAENAAASSGPGFFTGPFGPTRNTLLGDMGRLRSELGNYGISACAPP